MSFRKFHRVGSLLAVLLRLESDDFRFCQKITDLVISLEPYHVKCLNNNVL
jgi:hypothetical protein